MPVFALDLIASFVLSIYTDVNHRCANAIYSHTIARLGKVRGSYLDMMLIDPSFNTLTMYLEKITSRDNLPAVEITEYLFAERM